MKAAPMIERPDFPLMTLTEVQSFHHMQMPRWLFFDGRYSDMSLEAKVAYTFIFNRYQLSRLHGWVNDQEEVFIIYPRQALAGEMQISYRKCIECFKELVAHRLIWERRRGQGSPNQIYLARVDAAQLKTGYECAPFVTPEGEDARMRSAEAAGLEDELDAETPCGGGADVPGEQTQKCAGGISSRTNPAGQEVSEPHAESKELSYPKQSSTDVSQSVAAADEAERELQAILDGCDLWVLPIEARQPISDAIERLYYSDNYRIGSAVMPQRRIRDKLSRLEATVLETIYGKLTTNVHPVKNSSAYIMAVILNTISESEGDLLVDPYINGLRYMPDAGGGASCGGGW